MISFYSNLGYIHRQLYTPGLGFLPKIADIKRAIRNFKSSKIFGILVLSKYGEFCFERGSERKQLSRNLSLPFPFFVSH